jgi:hypothetical protein
MQLLPKDITQVGLIQLSKGKKTVLSNLNKAGTMRRGLKPVSLKINCLPTLLFCDRLGKPANLSACSFGAGFYAEKCRKIESRGFEAEVKGSALYQL